MRCDQIREAMSAGMDGETTSLERAVVDAHLAECPRCRTFASGAADLHRRVRVRRAEVVPDLSTAILVAAPSPAGRPARPWARYALLAVALCQLALAVPTLVLGDGPGGSVHVIRELGSWDVALAASWLAVAWHPRRAAGLLPFALALAVVMVATAVLDVSSGRTPAVGESAHLLDLAGLALVWSLARAVPPATPLIPAFRSTGG